MYDEPMDIWIVSPDVKTDADEIWFEDYAEALEYVKEMAEELMAHLQADDSVSITIRAEIIPRSRWMMNNAD
jgi:hypothetical protein